MLCRFQNDSSSSQMFKADGESVNIYTYMYHWKLTWTKQFQKMSIIIAGTDFVDGIILEINNWKKLTRHNSIIAEKRAFHLTHWNEPFRPILIWKTDSKCMKIKTLSLSTNYNDFYFWYAYTYVRNSWHLNKGIFRSLMRKKKSKLEFTMGRNSIMCRLNWSEMSTNIP